MWRENDTIGRVPIIVTGNDFSTLFAPLVRDGRMAKFYWHPEREDLVAILYQMYKVRAPEHFNLSCSLRFHRDVTILCSATSVFACYLQVHMWLWQVHYAAALRSHARVQGPSFPGMLRLCFWLIP